MNDRRRITIGILAHVDAGKTTLSEGILFRSGAIRKAGRVDHGDAFLDTYEQEKERGITIFSKQAQIELPTLEMTLLDTPGHVDFSAEMERTLQVLDYAILVVSGAEGVQGHTMTLWKLIRDYEIPAFAFINKMDLATRDGDEAAAKARLMEELKKQLGSECVDFSGDQAARDEEIATAEEAALEEFLETGAVAKATAAKAIADRNVVPCFFGAALKMEGIDELLQGLEEYCIETGRGSESDGLAARVFKINRDGQGERLTHLRIYSGTLKARMAIDTGAGEEEKINQIRIYSGDKYKTVNEAGPGTVCAVTGLRKTRSGQLIPAGAAGRSGRKPVIEAALSYGMILPEGTDAQAAFRKIRELEEEDPQLRIVWDERAQEIQVRLMGPIQLEVLSDIIAERYGMDVGFGEGRIAYRETISKAVCGAGHFEPLRHYAEVHLLMEPLPAGSGLIFDTACSEDDLDKNWQRLIFTHLAEKEHTGPMTGAPITDMKITLLGGRAHLKHTEGGDFRQATYRAIRQGLRKSLSAGEMKLLEPWYEFTLRVPAEMIGRAMADIQRMGGAFDEPDGEVLTGRAPVSEMKEYAAEVAAYTRGFGRLDHRFCGYFECHNTEEVLAASDYDPDRDVENTGDSVFCSHGAGHNVPWNESDEMMHVKTGWKPAEDAEAADADLPGATETGAARTGGGFGGAGAGSLTRKQEKELDAIFEQTYGRLRKESKKRPAIESREIKPEKRKKETYEKLPEFLLVDGYNIIFAWDELKELAGINIDSAREALIEILANYQGYKSCNLIIVFDAYRVKGGERRTEKHGNVTIVYTKEAETADTYIERTTYELAKKKYDVRVATSDRLEQMIIMGNDARKVPADEFKKEVEAVNEAISEMIKRNNWKNRIEFPNKIEIKEQGENED